MPQGAVIGMPRYSCDNHEYLPTCRHRRSAMESLYAGMTVNERLFLSGRLDEWDAALQLRDQARMIAILTALDLGDQSSLIVDRVLANAK